MITQNDLKKLEILIENQPCGDGNDYEKWCKKIKEKFNELYMLCPSISPENVTVKEVEREIAEAIEKYLNSRCIVLVKDESKRGLQDIITEGIKPLRDELDRLTKMESEVQAVYDEFREASSDASQEIAELQQQLTEAREALAEIKDEHQHLAELQQQLIESRERVKELEAGTSEMFLAVNQMGKNSQRFFGAYHRLGLTPQPANAEEVKNDA